VEPCLAGRGRASLVLKVADLTLNLDTREVDARPGTCNRADAQRVHGDRVLMRHAGGGRVMSRTLITEYAWGYTSIRHNIATW